MIGKHIVYVENRNGNSPAHVLQHETIDRVSSLLTEFGIKVDAIRADSASYSYEIIKSMQQAANRIFIRTRMTHAIESTIVNITQWEKLKVGKKEYWRGSTYFTPLRGNKQKTESLKEYRLAVTKEARKDGQINLFTSEAFNYQAFLTNNFSLL